jgi:histidyl-tRNA synthetase
LDYYTHTVFEITSNLLGAQSSVLGGGRYNGLVELLGGPKVSGIGWAAGVERLMIMLESSVQIELQKPVCILPVDESAFADSLALAQRIRHSGVRAEVLESGNMSKKMKRASKLNASYAVIMGSTEAENGLLTVKDFSTGQQESLVLEAFLKKLNS